MARSMHHLFQTFIDLLSSAETAGDFSKVIVLVAEALDLSCFAYLALPDSDRGKPILVSTYPTKWTSHYLLNDYQRIDPVIRQALRTPEPFRWGRNVAAKPYSLDEQRLFDEASQFGIRFGFTVPVHDGHGPIAALTFASDQRNAAFERCVRSHTRVLQLLAIYLHAHARRKLPNDHRTDRVELSPRELECLEWASRGKSAWEIGRIIGISHYTVASYLENAKRKLGVRTLVQAATWLAATKEQQS